MSETCAAGLFLHEASGRNWMCCPVCRYQHHPDDTGSRMLERAMEQSRQTPSPMAEVPAIRECSAIFAIPRLAEGTTRSPDEVGNLALAAAKQATE